MNNTRVRLTKAKETMLITLYARALHSRGNDPLLRDPWAEAAIDRIDSDFGAIKMSPILPLAIAVRARQFDTWTLDWIAAHPESVVLHLGCGLDSRAYRVDPPSTVRWFDVDYPQVIDLRRQLYPEHAMHRMIGSSVLDPGWLDEVPRHLPAMIVAEGLMMYLPADAVQALLTRLTDHFPGGHIAFDVLSSVGAWMARLSRGVRAAGAEFSWGVDNPTTVQYLSPRLELVEEYATLQYPLSRRLPWTIRTFLRAIEPFPRLRRINRLLLYRF